MPRSARSRRTHLNQPRDHDAVVVVKREVPVEKRHHPEQERAASGGGGVEQFPACFQRAASVPRVNHFGRHEKLDAERADPHQNALRGSGDHKQHTQRRTKVWARLDTVEKIER